MMATFTPPSPLHESGDVVLVVDDDPQIVRLVRAYLEQAGFAVRTAADGEDALHQIRTERPALVVLDLMLPRRDGLEVTRIVRGDPTLAATPILMLTARVEDIDRIVGLELGADDYVTKPFHPREVVARVKAILRRTGSSTSGVLAAPPPPPLALHGIRLDAGAHSVTCDGQPVALTPSEFTVLHLLMRNPGRAFTRTQIIEEGLGHDYEGLERTVDSHIRNLRRKLEVDPHRPHRIETVFGVGYRFAPPPTHTAAEPPMEPER
jgi:two-component system alkaline phosphatase synthesis response regulator PhoP